MATELNKDIIRESTVQVNDKPLIITLTEKQTIQIKQKGKKNSPEVEISIEDLFKQLDDGGAVNEDKVMISLADFRSLYLTDGDMDYKMKTKLESITARLLRGNKLFDNFNVY